MAPGRRIGITTTVPIEAIYAAGAVPVDLNNAFISHPDRRAFVEEAEIAGFPATTCGWIKGIYAAARRSGVEAVVGVMAGDCSNTQALLEIWQYEGLETIPFAYPYDRSTEALSGEIDRLCRRLGTDRGAAEAEKARLDPVRARALEVDRLTWEDDRISGFENHLTLVSASDFEGDPEGFGARADALIREAAQRPRRAEPVRLGYVGVPPILEGFYPYLESLGARVVYNETQRQFCLPYLGDPLTEAYTRFTYPYGIFARLEDIRREVARRGIRGVIHYVQSFCFRQMEDILLRKSLDVPVLTLEGDRPMIVDARTRTRLESFVEMLGEGP
ncbi:MAG: 2-hydroxyacyl-CoA dehydratase [Deferrisomatales bacterium]|nr:2-hydroxyacyl-CoA dehydratase [Deferrisomatales bacterium]